MKPLIWTGSALGALLLLFLALQLVPPWKIPGEDRWAGLPNRPLVIAHGGAKLLFPENTLEAFRGAAALGVDILEVDLLLTGDEALVAHHDLLIDRTSNGSGSVINHSLRQLKELNFGLRFETLAGQRPYVNRGSKATIAELGQLLEEFGTTHRFILELKNDGPAGRRAAHVLWGLIQKHQVEDRVLVSSFDEDTLKEFKRLSGGRVRTGASEAAVRHFVTLRTLWLDRLWVPDDAAFLLPVSAGSIRLDEPGLLERLKASGVSVSYWTVNDPEEMERLIDLGVDGLITDRPDLLNELLKAKGAALPEGW